MINKIEHGYNRAIYWLVQTITSPLLLHQKLPPSDLLSKDEKNIFNMLKTEKRRHDWLLGRWTAKHLVQQVAQEKLGRAIPLTGFSILARPDGSPQVIWEQPQPAPGFDCTISISHSAGVSFCALVEEADWPLGADVELIQPRITGFASDYFTADEQALVERCAEAWRPTLVTAIWSAKEAVLKALRVGLKQDTRSVSCLVEPIESSPGDWTPFAIQWENSLLKRTAPPLTGRWQIQEGFVLTLAVYSNAMF
jgi:4'-phosphopantetheinyl transferase